MKKENYSKSAIGLVSALMAFSAVTVLWIIITFAVRIANKDYTTTNIRKIQIKLVPQEWDFKTKNYLFISGDNRDAYLRNVQGEFETHNSPPGLFIYVHIYDILFFTALFYLLFLLRKFLISVQGERTFTLVNMELLNKIAKIVIWSAFADFVLIYYGLWFFIKDVNFAPNTRVSIDYNPFYFFGVTVAGYVLYSVVKIVEDGIKLKEENDLTI